MTAILQLSTISKAFTGVRALQDVSMTLAGGSIHALLGENGAGKSTLIRIATGLQRPDAGAIILSGQKVQFYKQRDATTAGIAVVHQECNLIDRFSVGENIMLDRPGRRILGWVRYDHIWTEAQHWLHLLDLDIDPRQPARLLNVAQRQLVEIAKAMSQKPRILLLDEPTASLTSHETSALFRVLRRLRDTGVAVGFISHKLEEVFEICDTVTVLRDGRNACDTAPLKALTRQDLIAMMIGRAERITTRAAHPRSDTVPVLELRGYASAVGHQRIDLTVRRGEILGLYGLVGAGRSELAKALIGLSKQTAGTVLVHGKAVQIKSVADALDSYGIGYCSEDRKTDGLILDHSVLDNAGITVWNALSNAVGFLRNRHILRAIGPVLAQLDLKSVSVHQPVGTLSGGNQQKVSVAKWIAAGVALLIVDEPSVGIDIKTKADLHDQLHLLAAQGTAIILITSDLPEMIDVADRIMVMDGYRIRGEVENTRNDMAVSAAIMGFIHRSEVS